MHYSPVLALLFIFFLSDTISAHRGCSTPLPANLTAGGPSQSFNITSGGRNRSYLLHIPTNYDINTPSPLIISYHGAKETPAISESNSRFSSSIYNQDFVVAYPSGVGHVWEGASYSVPGVDDHLFTNDLIDALSSKLCIDHTNIFASGKSNGGGFVGLMTCDERLSSRIKAFATVEGAFYNQFPDTLPCNISRTVIPIIDFQGGDDTRINATGSTDGNGGAYPSIDDWVAWKVSLNPACNPTPDQINITETVTTRTWMCGSPAPVHIAYLEGPLKHRWPGTEQTGNGIIPATPLIMQFFNQWLPICI